MRHHGPHLRAAPTTFDPGRDGGMAPFSRTSECPVDPSQYHSRFVNLRVALSRKSTCRLTTAMMRRGGQSTTTERGRQTQELSQRKALKIADQQHAEVAAWRQRWTAATRRIFLRALRLGQLLPLRLRSRRTTSSAVGVSMPLSRAIRVSISQAFAAVAPNDRAQRRVGFHRRGIDADALALDQAMCEPDVRVPR